MGKGGACRESGSLLSIELDEHSDAGIVVVRLVGVLSVADAPRLRDVLMKCFADQPAAVVVDLELLAVQHAVALNVFAVVARRTAIWSGGQLILASGPALQGRLRLQARALGRFVRIYPNLPVALASTRRAPLRRLAVWLVPADVTGSAVARQHVRDSCRSWECGRFEDDAVAVVDELVAHAIRRSTSDLVLRLELRRGLLTIAVTRDQAGGVDQDSSLDPLTRRILAELATASGTAPTLSGGTIVWVVLRVAAAEADDQTP